MHVGEKGPFIHNVQCYPVAGNNWRVDASAALGPAGDATLVNKFNEVLSMWLRDTGCARV